VDRRQLCPGSLPGVGACERSDGTGVAGPVLTRTGCGCCRCGHATRRRSECPALTRPSRLGFRKTPQQTPRWGGGQLRRGGVNSLPARVCDGSRREGIPRRGFRERPSSPRQQGNPPPRPLVGSLDQTLGQFLVPMPYSTLAPVRSITRPAIHISPAVTCIQAGHANCVGLTLTISGAIPWVSAGVGPPTCGPSSRRRTVFRIWHAPGVRAVPVRGVTAIANTRA
jgi:hypothetical protein